MKPHCWLSIFPIFQIFNTWEFKKSTKTVTACEERNITLYTGRANKKWPYPLNAYISRPIPAVEMKKEPNQSSLNSLSNDI